MGKKLGIAFIVWPYIYRLLAMKWQLAVNNITIDIVPGVLFPNLLLVRNMAACYR